MTVSQLKGIIGRRKLSFDREIGFQEQIERALNAAGISHVREMPVPGGKLDFFLPACGTALELKTKGSGTAVCRQVMRYLEDPRVRGVIVVSTKPMDMPMTECSVGGEIKPIGILELWRNF